MDTDKGTHNDQSNFYLNKWFLDCTTEEGEVLVFYAALLRKGKWEAPYMAKLCYHPVNGVTHRTRYSKVQFPEQFDELILWNDSRFDIEGNWEARAVSLEAKMFETQEGAVNWYGWQPQSNVHLKIEDRLIQGTGYVEQLVFTIPPWKIPMDELRWGRYHSPANSLVWIDWKGRPDRQWLWWNGERVTKAIVNDAEIVLPQDDIRVVLDRGVVLESEKKIFKVVKQLAGYIPGLKKSVPLQFLMADECKWFSKGVLYKAGIQVESGSVIHEWVNFQKQGD